MEFNSHVFILIFIPVVILFCSLFPKRLYFVLLLSSLVFYGWDSSIGLSLLVISTILVHYAKKFSLNVRSRALKTIIFLFVILLVILPFSFFRAASLEFFILQDLISKYPYLAILPAGISFYTFQLIGYLIDDLPDFRRFTIFDSLLFTSFFPQLIAGPIEKANNLMPQLLITKTTKFTFDFQHVKHGLFMIAVGLFFKTFLSDVFATYLPSDFYQLGFINCIGFILANGLILYFDFLGYSLIALGLALMFSIRLTLNFNRPYASTNIRQFWRCWHITLTRWFTSYVYKPIASSYQFSFQAKLIGAIVVFIFTALWHGFGLRFLVWGLSHMSLMLLTFIPSVATFFRRIPKYIGWFFTLLSVNILWLFFLFPLDKSIEILNSLVHPSELISISGSLRFVLLFSLLIVASLIYNPSVLMIKALSSSSDENENINSDYHLNIQDTPDMILSSFSATFTSKVNCFLENPFIICFVFFVSIAHFSFASTFIYFRF